MKTGLHVLEGLVLEGAHQLEHLLVAQVHAELHQRLPEVRHVQTACKVSPGEQIGREMYISDL